jgi:AcrR family transcriptional regulator
MRKPRDGQNTRETVIAAARKIFAARGFEGASLAMISKECGISDGLILHHFQSKKNLYQAVLEDLAQEYTSNLVQSKEASSSPQELMQKTLLATFDYWKQDTTYQRISLWSYLEGQNELVEKEAAFTAGMYQEVKRLQDQGFIDTRFSPIFLLTMVIGPIHSWLRNREQFQKAIHFEETTEELDQLFINQLIQLVMEIARKPVESDSIKKE